MKPIVHKFTLDMHSVQSQISIPVLLGDTNRELRMILSDGGTPYMIEDECLAKLSIKRPTGTRLEEFCSIEGNTTIVYNFEQNENTAAVPGIHECDVTLYDLDGKQIASPRFTMIPNERVINSDDIILTDENLTAVDAMLHAETERQAAEIKRSNAETERVLAELNRTDAELERSNAETERQASYSKTLTAAEEAQRDANETKEMAGNIDAALDEILAMQKILLGDYKWETKPEFQQALNDHDESLADHDEKLADHDESLAEADYLARYNWRVLELTADYNDYTTLGGRRGIAMLGLNEGMNTSDWEGGKYCEFPYAIMHPMSTGTFSLSSGAAGCGYVLVAKGVTHINTTYSVSIVDLTMFGDSTPFPTLGYPRSGTVLVPKGRAEELRNMTNWANTSQIEEVETW